VKYKRTLSRDNAELSLLPKANGSQGGGRLVKSRERVKIGGLQSHALLTMILAKNLTPPKFVEESGTKGKIAGKVFHSQDTFNDVISETWHEKQTCLDTEKIVVRKGRRQPSWNPQVLIIQMI